MREHRKYRRPEVKCSRPNCVNKVSFYGTRGLCVKHNQAYLNELEKQGKWVGGRIPTDEVIAHMDMLKSRGFGHRRISELAGIAEVTVRKIREQKKLQIVTARKILAITPPSVPFENVAPNSLIPVLGTSRRLQALVTIGYSQAELARRLDTTETVIWRLITGERGQTIASMARRVDELFQELQFIPGDSKRAFNKARKMGWAPPAAWDEIDDPMSEPFVGDSDVKADFVASVEDGFALGLDDFQLAERFGITVDCLRRRIQRWAA